MQTTINVTDEHLEHWGNFYTENHLRARGIRFDTFLRWPREIAEAVIFGQPIPLADEDGFLPLLPEQAEAAARVLLDVERIGRCDTCGVIDHHLAPPHFLCAVCAEKYGAYDYMQGCAL